MGRWSFPRPEVLKLDKDQNPMEGLLKKTAEPPQFLIQQVWGEAQEFSNKFSGDAEVAGLGTQFGNQS